MGLSKWRECKGSEFQSGSVEYPANVEPNTRSCAPLPNSNVTPGATVMLAVICELPVIRSGAFVTRHV